MINTIKPAALYALAFAATMLAAAAWLVANMGSNLYL